MTSIQDLPFSQACENNKTAILEVLEDYFSDKNASPGTSKTMIELGAGTGQHAVHFAKHLPLLNWQATDLEGPYLDACGLRIKAAELPNLPSPVALDVSQDLWPVENIEAAFTANSLHIMPWSSVERFFTNLSKRLIDGGIFFCYGPFNYQGQYTSQSNAEFDQWLKQRDKPVSYTHLRAHETVLDLVCRLLLEKKKTLKNIYH